MKVLIDDNIQEYTPEQIAQWTAELPEWRREQVLRYKHDAGRRQSLLAYRLLCKGLREEYGITEPPTFEYNEHGKPFLMHNAQCIMHNIEAVPYFSLSHCREAVACIIDDEPCGIDIECVGRRVANSIIRYSMDEREQSIIRESDNPQLAFLHLWTRKEAVLKLMGTGIRDTMKDVLRDSPYHIETHEADRWVMSLATCGHRAMNLATVAH